MSLAGDQIPVRRWRCRLRHIGDGVHFRVPSGRSRLKKPPDEPDTPGYALYAKAHSCLAVIVVTPIFIITQDTYRSLPD
ncbi:hypothetical protein BJY01DRAFT_228413 [Aspergillus pseudoustus]|uniref:Uncharacterized protein n=1 Tax=Aspergillus pseudoustus TaxID=1810923 RepID=A0ABR4ILC9_9EURO